MKRIVSLVLALSMVLSMFTFSFAGTGLKDVKGTKYEAAVEALVELGVVDGYADGTYLPEKVVTRNELAKLLVVAYGLESAAEVSTGVTPFADINAVANHWAAGYINVSADYKFVNGYPDGSFKGDNTVTYAEAITMCLRVLGYANEIESKGTWPTNYIAKAQELGLMEGIEFKSYNDGAKRGDIALLIWNMLRTKMWEVTSESEGDGLTSAVNRAMLNVKFKDYKYSDEATFSAYSIDYDSKKEEAIVKVTISGDKEVAGEYEYAKNDFYKFVEGTEVEVLVNTKDELLLTIVPTSDNKLVEGTLEDLDDANYTNLPSNVDYVYARANRKVLVATSELVVSNEYVEEVALRKDSIKINKTTEKLEDWEEEIILKNGERVSIDAIKEGDVLSTVVNGTETFYVIGYVEAEGKLTKYADNKITVSSDEYTLDANAKYVEDPEDEKEKAKDFANATSVHADMKNEEVRLVLDAMVGKVVRIEFDGNIGDNTKDTTYKFFVAMNEVERESSRVYTITLANEDGEEDYTFASNSEKGVELYNNRDIDLTGRFVAVKLNEDDEIVDIKVVADASSAYISDGEEYEYDNDTHDKYVALLKANAKYDEDEGALFTGTTKIWDVDNSVVVVTLLKDDKDTVNDQSDDVYSAKFSEGLEDIEDLNGENVIVIYDSANKFDGAIYVVLFDELADKSDVKAGTIKEYIQNKLGDFEATIKTSDGEEVAITKTNEGLANFVAAVYTTEEKEKKDGSTEVILKVKATLSARELSSGEGDRDHGYISGEDASKDGKKAVVTLPTGDTQAITINSQFVDNYDNKVFVLVEVEHATAEEKGQGDYVIQTIEVIAIEDIELEEFDRISGDLAGDEVIFIIRGMDERD